MRRGDHYFRTVLAVVSSPHVKQFVIGMTGQTLWGRRSQYSRKGCKHVVVIADKMTGRDALALEEQLRRRCLNDQRRLLYRKYHEQHRGRRHPDPAGGSWPAAPGDPRRREGLRWR